MRVLLSVAIVVALALAGCSKKDKGDDHEHETYQCPDGGPLLEAEDFPDHDNESFELSEQCPDDGGNGNGNGNNGGNTTPNVPPVLVLKAYDAPGGNETNVTLVGGSLTFSAEGSSDSDGSISGIAVTVTDSNQTRTLPLYAGGQFIPATFMFDRAGIVNVTAAMVDDRADFSIVETNVYINEVVTKESHAYTAGAPAGADAADCVGPTENAIVDNTLSEGVGFTVQANASFVEVSRTYIGDAALTSDIAYAICTPEGAAISDEFTSPGPNFSNNAERLPASVNYFVFALSHRPQSQAEFTITVHYEPRPA